MTVPQLSPAPVATAALLMHFVGTKLIWINLFADLNGLVCEQLPRSAGSAFPAATFCACRRDSSVKAKLQIISSGKSNSISELSPKIPRDDGELRWREQEVWAVGRDAGRTHKAVFEG